MWASVTGNVRAKCKVTNFFFGCTWLIYSEASSKLNLPGEYIDQRLATCYKQTHTHSPQQIKTLQLSPL